MTTPKLAIVAREKGPFAAYATALAAVDPSIALVPLTGAASLEGVDVVLAFEAEALAAAAAARVGLRVAVLPTLDDAFPGGLAQAQHVLVSHRHVRDRVREVVTVPVDVAGFLPPAGFAPPADRAAARAEAGLGEGVGVVVLSASLLDAHGANALLVQLGLAAGAPAFLFDVDQDVEAAEGLRRLAPIHDVRVGLFAAPSRERAFALADLVVCAPRAPEVPRALAAGAPLLLLCDGPTDEAAARALAGDGLAHVSATPTTLSVDLDAALAPAALEAGRRAVVAQQVGDGAAAHVAAARAAFAQSAEPALPRGLPSGIEWIAAGDGAVAAPGAPPRRPEPGGSPPRPAPPHDEDLERRIDAELEALKKRL